MILKGSQRAGCGQLAAHLMNDRDNDHVTLHELRGFVSDDLEGALAEAHAISKATQCKQYMFSLSLNPPKDVPCGIDTFLDAADRAEIALGLEDQPRAIVIHEKAGRRHAHVVWSRIDADQMKAINLPHFKNRLNGLSKELYLEHGWELPDGHKENGWKNPLNFTLDEWQQAKRIGLDPREIKQIFREAWAQSDGIAAFKNALEEHGYYLAKGDRRGFVAVDLQGEVFSVSRLAEVKTKELEARLGSSDGLPGVDEVREANTKCMTSRMRDLLESLREQQNRELDPLVEEGRAIITGQRHERERLRELQQKRWTLEHHQRQQRFRRGLRGLWDVLTGRAADIRQENEREAFVNHCRDRDQREAQFEAHARERHEVMALIEDYRKRQREARMRVSGQVAFLMGLERAECAPVIANTRTRTSTRSWGPEI